MVNNRLPYLKSRRTILRKAIPEKLSNADQFLQSETTTLSQLNVVIEELEDTTQKLETLTGEIIELMQDPSEADIEAEAAKIEADVSEIKRVIRQLAESRRQVQSESEPTMAEQERASVEVEMAQLRREMEQLRANTDGAHHQHPAIASVRLPKLEVEKFEGDILRFKEFWDHFDVAIGSNTHLRAVEKLNYLRACLDGEAKRVIAGLTATDENYDVAVSLLRERYGDTQASIDAHYSRLMDLPMVSNQTPKIRNILDKIESHLRCLQALGEDIEHRHFISLIMAKLPRGLVAHLEETKGARTAWTVDLLRTSLHNILNAREIADRQNPGSSSASADSSAKAPSKPQNNRYALRSTTETLMVSDNNQGATARQKPTSPCIFCGRANHYYSDCRTVNTAVKRREKVRGLRRCFLCLRTGHSFGECKSRKPCYYCKETKSHHQSLCPQKFPSKHKSNEQAAVASESNHTSSKSSSSAKASPSLSPEPNNNATLAAGESVVLQTASAMLYNPNLSVSVPTRVLLDCGSNRTYISKSLSRQLGLQLDGEEHFSVGTFGSEKRKSVKTSSTKVLIGLKDGSKKKIGINVVEQITGSITRLPIDADVRSFLQSNSVSSQDMADSLPSKVETSEIGLLIGNDYYLDFINLDRIEVKPGLYLLSSRLGWIMTGRIEADADARDDLTMFVDSRFNTVVPAQAQLLRFSVNGDGSLPCPTNIQDFWNLETIGIKDSPHTIDDEQAIDAFNSTVKSSENGRYQVSWPWRDKVPDLPSNYQLALGRFRSTAKKLQGDQNLFKKYRDIIQEQQRLGIIEKVPAILIEKSLKHYIPHHPVITPSKATTKVRIVFDASAKVNKAASSLNECLYRGPVILEDLCGLLLRFRLHRIALTADIEKAFLQVGLQETDRDVTRFFWFKDDSLPSVDDNIQEYRFCRVPFGVISSPFLLGATIQFHLPRCTTETNKDSCEAIRNGLYVDNVITGVDSEEQAYDFYRQAKQIFASASMNLREWSSNSKTFLQHIPETNQIKGSTVKVLGLAWDTDSDEINVCTPSLDRMQAAETKRQVLNNVASFFDPLGLFAPITLKAKLLLRRISNEYKEWDAVLDPTVLNEWKSVSSTLVDAARQEIPRLIDTDKSMHTTQHEYQLLSFCDASAEAYATAVYLKIICGTSHQVHLVYAKTRLSPSKQVSIPKMELLAAVIAVRCLNFIETQLKMPITRKKVWTDSTCVLHWLHSTKPKPVFIENRLKEIRKSADISFAYVKSAENAADIASRGACSVMDLKASSWFHGPAWLQLLETEWPAWTDPTLHPMQQLDEACDNSCKRIFEVGTAEHTMTHSKQENQLTASNAQASPSISIPPYGMNVENFSSLVKLYRTTAWATRFVNRLKGVTPADNSLTASEIADAKRLWDRHIQHANLLDVITAVLNKTSCNLKDQLNVQLDHQQILRCHGRFGHSSMCTEQRNPKLLPRESHYTKLVIRQVHAQNLHAGVSHTLSEIRQEYWIPQGRSAVKKVLRQCQICKKAHGGPYALPQMPHLPAQRVNRSQPFSYVGLDYLGPLLIKTSTGCQKVWICLFTCMAVRAVHLELISDMSTEQFLLCLRRFIARRRKPILILSDNASQFKLANHTLDRLYGKTISNAKLKDFASQQHIAWKFITENAPWMGGFYERLVGSVKKALKKSIGRLFLSFDQLHTCVLEVESIVNERPLTYVGDSLEDLTVLTPRHFLILNPRSANDPLIKQSLPSTSTVAELIVSWKRGINHLNQFWKVWSTEYLTSLRERGEGKHRQPRVKELRAPNVNDLVLVKESLAPRGKWTMARICELLSSNDGRVRSAKLQIAGGRFLQRPIRLLYPFELARNEAAHYTAQKVEAEETNGTIEVPPTTAKPSTSETPNAPSMTPSASSSDPAKMQLPISGRLPLQAKTAAMQRLSQSSTNTCRS